MAVNNYNENCPVGVILKILGGKWKTLIIYTLLDGTKRFNELPSHNPQSYPTYAN